MGFPLGEVLRIAAMGVGAAVAGPAGATAAAMLTGAANVFDKEDEPDTDEESRKMKRERREGWIDTAKKLEKQKPPLSGAVKGAELRTIIIADIWETEGRRADDQEVNLYAEAVSAAARRKL